MKRFFSVLLIALLLVLPVMTAHAEDGQYVYVDDGLLSADELATVNAAAERIAENRSFGVYYFYYSDVEDVISYAETFADEHVTQENALVLGFNADYRYFLRIGPLAEEVFPDAVCEGAIMDAYRSVTGDPQNKLLAYLNAADQQLAAYQETQTPAPAQSAATGDLDNVSDAIARTKTGRPTLVDKEHLLSDSEAEALSKKLLEIGDRYQCDVIVATVPDLGWKTAEEYADDFFDYNGYGYEATPDETGKTINGDGILLLLAMQDRDFAISTSGYAIRAFTDYGIQTYLEDRFLPYLSRDDYNRGFNVFADACDTLLGMAREGVPYDHRRVYVDGWSDAQLLSINDRAESLANAYGVGIYYLESPSLSDAERYAEYFADTRLLDDSAILLVNGSEGHSIVVTGSYAKNKFTDAKVAEIEKAVAPHLSGQTQTAIDTYFSLCEQVVSDYQHVIAAGGVLSEDARRAADGTLKDLYQQHRIGLYFVYDEAGDPNALADALLSSGAVYESNAVVFGANAEGSAVLVKGDYAREKFSAKKIAGMQKDVAPYLAAKDVKGAVDAFAQRSESIINWRPVNWLTFAVAAISGGLFGFIPVSGMKRQLTSVSKQTDAEAYMQPDTFTMTQNSNVLMGKHTSRSVHVVHTESSGGSRGGGGGSSFHGGSSTHTSSSGGTHGGHSGKF